jgi:hypothetical protein
MNAATAAKVSVVSHANFFPRKMKTSLRQSQALAMNALIFNPGLSLTLLCGLCVLGDLCVSSVLRAWAKFKTSVSMPPKR